MKKRHIAVLMSLLFAAPAGMVALAQSESESTAAAVEIQAVPAEPVIVAQEVVVVTDQSAQPAVIAETTTVVVPIAEVTYVQPKPMSTAEWIKTNGFREDDSRMLPRQIGYFDRLEQDRRNLVANAAPTESGEELRQLPAQTAYFNRVEQQRLASLQPQQPVVARIEVQPRTSEEVAQAGSAEVAMADSSAIR